MPKPAAICELQRDDTHEPHARFWWDVGSSSGHTKEVMFRVLLDALATGGTATGTTSGTPGGVEAIVRAHAAGAPALKRMAMAAGRSRIIEAVIACRDAVYPGDARTTRISALHSRATSGTRERASSRIQRGARERGRARPRERPGGRRALKHDSSHRAARAPPRAHGPTFPVATSRLRPVRPSRGSPRVALDEEVVTTSAPSGTSARSDRAPRAGPSFPTWTRWAGCRRALSRDGRPVPGSTASPCSSSLWSRPCLFARPSRAPSR